MTLTSRAAGRASSIPVVLDSNMSVDSTLARPVLISKAKVLKPHYSYNSHRPCERYQTLSRDFFTYHVLIA